SGVGNLRVGRVRDRSVDRGPRLARCVAPTTRPVPAHTRAARGTGAADTSAASATGSAGAYADCARRTGACATASLSAAAARSTDRQGATGVRRAGVSAWIEAELVVSDPSHPPTKRQDRVADTRATHSRSAFVPTIE